MRRLEMTIDKKAGLPMIRKANARYFWGAGYSGLNFGLKFLGVTGPTPKLAFS